MHPTLMQDRELRTIGVLRNWQRSSFGDNRFGGCALLTLGVRSGCCARLGGTSVLCLLGQRRKVSRETRYRSSAPSCPYSPKCPEGGFFSQKCSRGATTSGSSLSRTRLTGVA